MPQVFDRSVVDAVEKCAREREAFVVLLHGASTYARPQALLDLEPDAPRCARKEFEQLRLIREVHPLIRRAIAQAEHVVQLANGFAHAHRAHEGAVIDRRVVLTGTAHDDELGRRTFGDFDEAVISRVALHGDVETRPEALDQPELLEQSRELARHVLPLDTFGVPYDARPFVFGKRAAEITEQPCPHALRFPDVHHLAIARDHSVHAWLVGGVLTHVRSHRVDLLVARRRAHESYF